MTDTVFLPVTSTRRSSDGLHLSATLDVSGSGVDGAWLRTGIKRLLQAGKNAIMPMGNPLLPVAGKLLSLGENMLELLLTQPSARKLAAEGCYGYVALSVKNARIANGTLVGGELGSVALTDSKSAPFMGKRAGVQYVDAEMATVASTLREYAASHPEPRVRDWAARQIEAIEISKAAAASNDPLSEWVAERRVEKLLHGSRS